MVGEERSVGVKIALVDSDLFVVGGHGRLAVVRMDGLSVVRPLHSLMRAIETEGEGVQTIDVM